MISSIIFVAFLIGSSTFFFINAKKIRRNILLGKDISIKDNKRANDEFKYVCIRFEVLLKT